MFLSLIGSVRLRPLAFIESQLVGRSELGSPPKAETGVCRALYVRSPAGTSKSLAEWVRMRVNQSLNISEPTLHILV